MGKRIEYIDTAKGMLICMVIYGHSILYDRMLGGGFSGTHIVAVTMMFFSSFNMQTFFLITGYCSSFKLKWTDFIKKQVKTIFLPYLLLSTIGAFLYQSLRGNFQIYTFFCNRLSWFLTTGEWFIMALFGSKLMLWLILKIERKRIQLFLIIILYLLGLTLDRFNLCSNFIYHRHMLIMLPYMYIGYLLRGRNIIPSWNLVIMGSVILLLQTLLAAIGLYHLPHQDYGIDVTYENCLIHFVNVIIGSALIIKIAYLFPNNKILNVLGKGSLLVYLWNGEILMLLILLLRSFWADSMNPLIGYVFYLIIVLLSVVVFYILVKLLYNNKYLCWLVGKW